jgi:DNA-binding NarL/FixJ family response regulator
MAAKERSRVRKREDTLVYENQVVRIVGQNGFLNQLLAFVINREFHILPTVAQELDGSGLEGGAEDSPLLVLIDDNDARAKAALFKILEKRASRWGGLVAALFNIDPLQSNARDAIRYGARGVFYTTDEIPEVLKGIQSLLKGEICIPSPILIDLAMNRAHGKRTVEENALTIREMEILSLVSTGAKNQQIAAELFISPHTVKTHMYNIFRKIGVDTRLNATLWAAQNLHIPLPHVRVRA